MAPAGDLLISGVERLISPRVTNKDQPSSQGSALSRFLPTTAGEMAERGWKALDVLLVTGDAYVDHPSFGAALIGRVLEAAGHRVGIVAQPDWTGSADIARMGAPRLLVGVTAGAMDSMVNHYTAHKRRRSDDAYTPGGAAGRRPDRACQVYADLARRAFGPNMTIVLGGVEASLRRLAHYDYWDDRVRSAILAACAADLVVYGQGERPILELARRLASGEDRCGLVDIPGTAVAVGDLAMAWLDGRDREVISLPSFEEVAADKRAYGRAARIIHREQNHANAAVLVQRHGQGGRTRYVVVNPPAPPPTTEDLDRYYALPFERDAHPSYGGAHLPALEQIRGSVTILRGCAAGCSFCSITEHQGREVVSRSQESVLAEVVRLTRDPAFRGTVTDLGGPTANMWGMGCTNEEAHAACRRPSCLYPAICKFFRVDHGPLVELYRRARAVPGVKHLFVGSGVRYDLAQADAQNGERYLEELVQHHVSGQLKVAPEHVSAHVLQLMKKPPIAEFERFRRTFDRISRAAGKEQYLVPYFVSSHPGCRLEDAVELMEYLQANRWRPQQVQDFIPTPMTLATDMHWSGLHPATLEPVEAVHDLHQKRMQKALIRWADPDNRSLVDEALRRTGRSVRGAGWRGRPRPGAARRPKK